MKPPEKVHAPIPDGFLDVMRQVGVSAIRASKAWAGFAQAIAPHLKTGRHQWHYCRPGAGQRRKHRRTRGPPGVVICKRRGCDALRVRGQVIGAAVCCRQPAG